MKTLRITLFLVLSAFAGCDRARNTTTITADELLLAQGGQAFTVVTPESIDPRAFAGLALKYPDGKILPFGSTNGFKANQELKVIIFDPQAGNLQYAILGAGSTHRGSSANFPSFGMRVTNTIHRSFKAGEPLIRFATGNSVAAPPAELADGTFEIIFHIQESKIEQDGTGQPATRPESKSEGSDKPQPESEGRSR